MAAKKKAKKKTAKKASTKRTPATTRKAAKSRSKSGPGREATQFKKGKSGNPRGRRKLTPEQKQFKKSLQEMRPEALKTLHDLNKQRRNRSVALKAANSILNRTDGLPERKVKVEAGQSLFDLIKMAHAKRGEK